VILAGTLLGALLLQWRVCMKTLVGLKSTRRLPRSMFARRAFEIELSISNPKQWLGSWLVLAQDRIVRVTDGDSIVDVSQGIGLLYPSIPPNTTRIMKYRCTTDRRGRYRFLGTEITTRFPLGLMRGRLPPMGNNTFVVQPALGRLLQDWRSLFDVRSASAKQRRTKSLSDEGEFFGLRNYRSGDSPRWIHWRSSARRNELVIKQFQQEDSQEFVILLDLYRPKDLPKSSKDKLLEKYIALEDQAIEFVSTVVNQIATTNHGVISVAIADSHPELVSRVASRAQASSLLDRLAVASHADGNATIEAMQLMEREHLRVAKLVVVSTRSRTQVESNKTLSSSLKKLNNNFETAPFWKSMTWLDVSSDDLCDYFARAESTV
jgi:uncharacterized protein (DUF58 family)